MRYFIAVYKGTFDIHLQWQQGIHKHFTWLQILPVVSNHIVLGVETAAVSQLQLKQKVFALWHSNGINTLQLKNFNSDF